MDLQYAAVIVALASPVVMTAVAWGAYQARMSHLERRQDKLEDSLEVAHRRIDNVVAG